MLKAFPAGQIKLGPSLFHQRQQLVLDYMLRLKTQNLLRPYLLEAGLWSYAGGITCAETDAPENWHWGWESLTCDLRGHILGHWLSASAHLIVQSNNQELRGKADAIVLQLAKCQQANGGQWCGPFSEKLLQRIASGKMAWAPQYTLHKLLYGLLEMYTLTSNTTALDILNNFADYFYDFTQPMSREQLDDLLDYETGGMLEVWAALFEITQQEKHRTLITRYYRHRFFDPLLEGQDVLTNKHANTHIPEILGAAKAYEVTGDERFRRIVESFWDLAVSKRGMYCTGGCSCGEVWTAPFSLSGRLHAPHEHCTVFNMMRLANSLFRWTGHKKYADYWERNLLNAVLAQQNPKTGMVSYFLPLGGESRKIWGSETNDFWCCHGTLMQAHAIHHEAIVFEQHNSLVIGQYIPFETTWNNVHVSLKADVTQGLSLGQRFLVEQNQSIQLLDISIPAYRPEAFIYTLELEGEGDFELRLRVPDWVSGKPELYIIGE